MKIKLYTDIVFKWIFGRQEHTGPLISFLNAAIGSPGKFSEVRILNPFDVSEPFKNEKQGILDIRGHDNSSDEWFDLEVQVVVNEFYPQRSKFYLAGMYRDQLPKDSDANYHKLKPCYGIHILVDTLFEGKDDAPFWHNHFAMLNTRSHKPLADHWHLYYIELKKFLTCFHKRAALRPETELEEWSYFLGSGQDNTKPLDSRVSHNPAIQEVYQMLETFTKEDHLRERYRVQEEFLRVQRTERAIAKKMQRDYLFVVNAHKREKAEKEAALKAKEAALKAKEAALKVQADLKKKSIAFMKKHGSSPEEIAAILSMPLEDVMALF